MTNGSPLSDFFIQQVTEWRVTKCPIQEHVWNHLIHSFSEVHPIPIDVLWRFCTGSDIRHATCNEYIEVVWFTFSTAATELLLEPILSWILHDSAVCIPVISIGDDSMGKLLPEVLQFCLEECIVAVALVVHTLHTPYVISIICRSQWHGQWQAPR